MVRLPKISPRHIWMSCWKIQISYKLRADGHANESYLSTGVLRAADGDATRAKYRWRLTTRYMEKIWSIRFLLHSYGKEFNIRPKWEARWRMVCTHAKLGNHCHSCCCSNRLSRRCRTEGRYCMWVGDRDVCLQQRLRERRQRPRFWRAFWLNPRKPERW